MQESGIYDYICKIKIKRMHQYSKKNNFNLNFYQKVYKLGKFHFKLEMDICSGMLSKQLLSINSTIKADNSQQSSSQTDEIKLFFKYIFKLRNEQLKYKSILNKKDRVQIIRLLVNNKQIKKMKLNSITLIYQDQWKKLKIFVLINWKKNLSQKFIQQIINHEKSPKILAIYIDIIIRRDEGRNEIETDKLLTQIFCLFQLLYQRDIFFSTLLRTIIQKIAQFLVQTSLTLKIEINQKQMI
ncbi:unnamed protein product [Paramecium pentaurelia]|uniref:Cullin family profile domain-containing protein n=1 Tax=Paramecium pentaurelia TaxID=43138 RepID=A0A8S1VRE9_9CILI|nr:unnamed protein product [Paramecium pentaurelia]